jgi:hypothetical protein
MQFQAIEMQQRVEESMRGCTKSSLVKHRACHNVSHRRSGGRMIRRNTTGSLFRHCHIPLTYKTFQVLSHDHWHRPTQLHHGTEGEKRASL